MKNDKQVTSKRKLTPHRQNKQKLFVFFKGDGIIYKQMDMFALLFLKIDASEKNLFVVFLTVSVKRGEIQNGFVFK